jgi:hypothetical protein
MGQIDSNVQSPALVNRQLVHPDGDLANEIVERGGTVIIVHSQREGVAVRLRHDVAAQVAFEKASFVKPVSNLIGSRG